MPLLASPLLAVALAAAAAPQASDEMLARAFVDSLTAGDVRRLERVAARPDAALLPWRAVRDVFDAFSCIEVDAYRVLSSSTPQALEIELTGSGISTTVARTRRPLPRRWTLKRVDGRLAGAATAATQLAESALAPDAAGGFARRVAAAETNVLRAAAETLATANECRDAADACRAAAHTLLAEARRRGDPAAAAYALAALTYVEASRSKEAARPFAEQARKEAERSGSAEVLVAIRYYTGWAETIYDARSTNREVAVHYEVIRSVADEAPALEEPRFALHALSAAAAASLVLYDIAGCFKQYEDLGERSRVIGWRRGELFATMGQGRAAASVVDFERARAHFANAAELAAALGERQHATHMLNLIGQTFLFQGQPRKALSFLERGLAQMPSGNAEGNAMLEVNTAACLLGLGRAAEASSLIGPALETLRAAQSVYLAPALQVTAHVRLAEGRIPDALTLMRESIAGAGDSLWGAYAGKGGLASILMECGFVDEAIDELNDAVDLVERRRMVIPAPALAVARYFGEPTYTHIYELLLDAYAKRGRYEDALAVSERMRARLLMDVLHGHDKPLELSADETARLDAANGNVVRLNRALIAKRGDEAQIRADLQRARRELDEVMTDIRMRRPASSRHILEPGDLLDALPRAAGEAAIEFAAAGESVIALIARDGRVTGIRLPLRKGEIEASARRLAERTARRDARYAEDARALFDALIAPLQRELHGVTDLTVIPAPFLWNVSFETLLSPAGRALDDSYAIAYAPSLIAVARASRRTRTATRKEFVAFADPTVARSAKRSIGETYRSFESLPRLEHAASEARAVARLYDPGTSDILIGDAARESVFKQIAGDYRILHLGTHGLAETGAPLYSALLLAAAKDDDDDGLLEMREIIETRLNADVAVLAACDTARGDVYAAEGAISLSWAFLAAGCRSTVVSRWKADSASTAKLMTAFHRALAAARTPAAALREARAALRREQRYRHPFYWANFVVVGGR